MNDPTARSGVVEEIDAAFAKLRQVAQAKDESEQAKRKGGAT